MAEIVAILGVVAASYFIYAMEEQPGKLIPWMYRFWGIVGVWSSLLLPRKTVDMIVNGTLARFTGSAK